MAMTGRAGTGCSYAFCGLMALMGGGVLAAAAQQLSSGRAPASAEVLVPGILGFALLAGAAGGVGLTRRMARRAAEEEARRAQFPGQPWRWKLEWQQPCLEASTGAGALGLWIFAVAWNAISFPVCWMVLHDQARKPAALLVLLFPLVGLGVLSAAIYKTLQWRRYGRPRFSPASLPGVIGGYLGGLIEVPARVPLAGAARLALRCVRRVTHGSGKNRHTDETVLWEKEEQLDPAKWVTGASRTEIPVLFYIPPECVATDEANANNCVVWRLQARAEVPGVDFAADFEVPVFATGETAEPPLAGKPVLEEYQRQELDASALHAAGIERTITGFRFSTNHLWGTKLGSIVLTLALAGGMAAMWGHGLAVAAWLVVLLFLAISVAVTADLVVAASELSLERDEVVVRVAGLRGTQETRLPRSAVARVHCGKGMAVGSRQFYQLQLAGAQGADPLRPQPGEPLAVKLLRMELKQAARELGVDDPAKMGPRGAHLIERFRNQPGSAVTFARHVPGPGVAESVAALVLAEIRGGK